MGKKKRKKFRQNVRQTLNFDRIVLSVEPEPEQKFSTKYLFYYKFRVNRDANVSR